MTKKFRSLDERVEMCSTDNPSVTCTKLPEFWRANKKFSAPFTVQFADRSLAPEGVRVTITAANHKNPNPELKNNQTIVTNGVARFNDLRFVGKSGRDTKFDVFIHVETDPVQMFTYKNAIKVTVDGPRPPRPKNEKPLSPKRKISDYSAFEDYHKRPRHETPQMYGNLPFNLLANMPSCSVPNSPEPSESSHSPYNHIYIPPSPQSVISSHSETRASSTVSTMSPKTLPLRKRISLADSGHYYIARSNEDEEHADLEDLIDTSRLAKHFQHQMGNHHVRQEISNFPFVEQAHSTFEQNQSNFLNCMQNNRLDFPSMLSSMSPENRLYFLYILNYYCSNGQDLLNTTHSTSSELQYPFSTN